MKRQYLAYHSSYILLQAFADALLVIPKILAQNSGYDPQETIVKLQVIESRTIKSDLVLQVSIPGIMEEINKCVIKYFGGMPYTLT